LRSERSKLGSYHPLLIGGEEVRTGAAEKSLNPANPAEVVGVVAQAGVAEADAAIAAARAAFPQWSRTGAGARATILERAGALLREARFDLAALEVFEVGKTWEEADADVAEAIDFCRYYAGEMRRIASTNYPVPGELNIHHYSARGIAAIIAPWNFPLAILCGMTAAALVAGNCAIMKPSEQSAVIGARLARRHAVFARPGRDRGRLSGRASRGGVDRLHRVERGWLENMGSGRAHRAGTGSAQEGHL
jgi:RHH-type proline utilization regulon transcriptional repressor/proline dehydrogenase/delta 1-pyrroline-5-carboxylate dehydrogenase